MNARTSRPQHFASTVVLTAALVCVAIAPASAGDHSPKSNHRELHLRAYFENFAGPEAPVFGDQFTLAGSVARFDTPDDIIGKFVIHAVVTAPFAAETLLYGVLDLPEGQISFTGLSPTQEPRKPGPITGGTGSYRRAHGELEHVTHEGGVEEFILTINGQPS